MRGIVPPQHLTIHDSFLEEKLRDSYVPFYLYAGGGGVTYMFGEFGRRN